jgi:hypothetical protein
MNIEEWKVAQENNSEHRLTVHHRRCRSNGGSDNPENISFVTEKKHQAWHLLFSNKTPQQIVDELNKTWLPLDKQVMLTTKIKNYEPVAYMVTIRA